MRTETCKTCGNTETAKNRKALEATGWYIGGGESYCKECAQKAKDENSKLLAGLDIDNRTNGERAVDAINEAIETIRAERGISWMQKSDRSNTMYVCANDHKIIRISDHSLDYGVNNRAMYKADEEVIVEI